MTYFITSSAPDPFSPIYEYPPQGANGIGYSNTQGRTQVSSFVPSPDTTKTIIVGGQSLMATASGTAPYTTVSANAQNLNIYDGGIYAGADPILGASYAPSVGPSSVSMRIADRIIVNNPTWRVIMVPIAIGGTPYISWVPSTTNSLFTRIKTAIMRCRARGIEPDKIIWGEGETDRDLGTSSTNVRNSIWAIVDGIRALDCNATFYIGKYTMVSGSISTAVQTGIDNSVDVSRDIVAGYDADNNATVVGGYRLADQTHLSDTGLTLTGNGWADLIYP